MIYKTFPFLSAENRVKGNTEQPMPVENFLQPLVVFKDDSIKKIHELRINYQLNRPVYHLIADDGKSISKYADNGKLVDINEQKAIQLATIATGHTSHATVKKIKKLDQWVPRVKYLKHLPIYKVYFTDDASTRVYISSLSGEVISLTTRSDRFWAWVGAIPHWIYFKDIRLHRDFWVQLVSWSAGLGFIMALTGVITGLARYKKKPNANFKRFKNKWYNLHYYFGLIFGLFVCTWVFSGLMSMTPFGWTPSTQLSESSKLKWQGTEFTLNTFDTARWNRFAERVRDKKLQEVNFSLFNHTLFARTFSREKNELISLNSPSFIPSAKNYEKIVRDFDPSDVVVENILLEEYDNYYYSRLNDKMLPIIRITTQSDIAYYINPQTTEIVYKCANKNRVQRWIYHGLHSLDFSFLTSNGVLWDIVVIFLLLGGTVISITATGLGIKFTKRKIEKHFKAKR